MTTICKKMYFLSACIIRQTSFRFATVFLSVLLLVVLMVSGVSAQGFLQQSQTNEKKQVVQKRQGDDDSAAIPWDLLDESSRQLVRNVVSNKTIFRRMPQQIGYCDRELYDFLICHPDVVVEIWELLGVTQLSLTETGTDEYLLKEGATSSSKVRVLYKSDNLCIVHAAGEYDAPMTPRKIKGDAVLVLRSRFGRDKSGRPIVQSNLDSYVQIHNPGAEMLAKLLTPVVGKIADNNFEQAMGFVMSLSDAAQDDFEIVQTYADRLQNVRPEVAEEFALVAEAVFDREVERYVAQAADPQKSLGDLVRQSTSPTDSALVVQSPSFSTSVPPAPTRKYNLRVGLEVETQELAFAQSKITEPYQSAYQADDTISGESRLLVPGEMMAIDAEERFFPYDDREVVQETTRDGKQFLLSRPTTKNVASPDGKVAFDSGPNERTTARPPITSQGKAPATEVSPLPSQRSLNITRDNRTIDTSPRKADEPVRSDRVIISAISPRSTAQSNQERAADNTNGNQTPQRPRAQQPPTTLQRSGPQQPTLAPPRPGAMQSPTQFGTVTPVIPQPTL